MADDSALVLVTPDDSVETIIEKVRGTKAAYVQLLVSEGAPALQILGAMGHLQRTARAENIGLLLITSDEKTLNAAHLCQVEALGVTGAQVQSVPNGGRRTYDTRRLGTRPAPVPPIEPDQLQNDEEFLRALDTAEQRPRAAETTLDEPPVERPRRPQPRRRDDDQDTEDAARERTAARPRSRPAALPPGAEEQARRTAPRPDARRVYDDEEPQPQRRPFNLLVLVLPLLLLGILVAGGFFLLRSQAVVMVRLPAPPTSDVPFNDLVIPIVAAAPTDANSAAVQAIPVETTVVFTETGVVAGETQAPNNPARGTVTLYNYGGGAVNLPPGSEFVAFKPDGQEVRFTADSEVSVPPASTRREGVNIVTAPGAATVNITARSPGSASNVEGGTISQFALPGQGAVAFSNQLAIEHGPISGGDEKAVRIVTEQDVQQLLPAALTGLDAAAPNALQAQTDALGANLRIDSTTLLPGREQLSMQGEGQVYELIVTPPVGQEVTPEQAAFSVTVRTIFRALATPADQPLKVQFQNTVPRQLLSEGKLTTGVAPTVSSWRWDGSRLLVSGVLRPDGPGPTLDAAELAAIRSALLGKTRAEAQAILDQFVAQGILSGYTLPNIDQLPGLAFQLDVQTEIAMTNRRVLALDVGARRIGVAMSDETGILSTPLTTIKARSRERAISEIMALVRQHHVVTVVVGWPLNMNGGIGPQAQSVRVFADALEAELGQQVQLFDERLTSVVADQILRDMGLREEKRRERIDAMAASIILQDYLDHHRSREAMREEDD